MLAITLVFGWPFIGLFHTTFPVRAAAAPPTAAARIVLDTLVFSGTNIGIFPEVAMCGPPFCPGRAPLGCEMPPLQASTGSPPYANSAQRAGAMRHSAPLKICFAVALVFGRILYSIFLEYRLTQKARQPSCRAFTFYPALFRRPEGIGILYHPKTRVDFCRGYWVGKITKVKPS